MKHWSLRLLVGLTVLALPLIGCAGPATPTSIATVRVAADATFPPFETVDEQTKEMVGFDIDLMKAIAEKVGLQIEFINVGFDPMLAGIAQCQYDVAISAITITDERQQQMAFSEPYFAAGQLVVVRQSEANILSRDQLTGKVVGSQIGTTGAMEIEKIAGANLKTYDTFDLAFQDLINGQIDAVIADNVLALGYVGKQADTLKTVGEVFTSENYGVAVCKTNTDLLAKINQGLAAVKADGTLDNLIQKWMAGGQ